MPGFAELFGLFTASLIAATLFPMGSEVILATLVAKYEIVYLLVVVATLGNVLGSWVNYAIGRWGGTALVLRWAKWDQQQLQTQIDKYEPAVKWSLLFAWLPVIGDPITVVAGLTRVHWLWFTLLVTLGKAARYLLVAYLALEVI